MSHVLQRRNQVLNHLFGEHHGWLVDRLRARMGCRHDAADMAAETFAQIVALPYAQAIREPRALLTTIAKRLIFASWRRRDLERAYLESLAAEPEQFESSPEDRYLVMEALLEVDQLLHNLSSKARAAFLYSQLEGWTYARIGAELGVSAPRVHQYVVQGLKAICAVAR